VRITAIFDGSVAFGETSSRFLASPPGKTFLSPKQSRPENAVRLHSVSEIVDTFDSEDNHGAGIQAGRDLPQSGI
jgi:hypothetical protein